MTAHDLDKRFAEEVLEAITALTDDGDAPTTDAVVEHVFGDPEENARHGDPVGAVLDDLEATGYVRRETRDADADVWTNADAEAFHRDYVDTAATWPPGRDETR